MVSLIFYRRVQMLVSNVMPIRSQLYITMDCKLDNNTQHRPMGNEQKEFHFNHEDLIMLNNTIISICNQMAEREHHTGGVVQNNIRARRYQMEWLNIKINKYIKQEMFCQRFTSHEQMLIYDILRETINHLESIEGNVYNGFVDVPDEMSEDDCEKDDNVAKNCLQAGVDNIINTFTPEQLVQLTEILSRVQHKLMEAYAEADGMIAEAIKRQTDELGNMICQISKCF